MKKIIVAVILLAVVIGGSIVWSNHNRQQKIERYMDIFGGEQYSGSDAHSPTRTGSAQFFYKYTYTFEDDGSCTLDVRFHTKKQTGYTERQFTDLKWTVEAEGKKFYLRVIGLGGKDKWEGMATAAINGRMEIRDYTEDEKEIYLKGIRNQYYDLLLENVES